MAVVYLFAHHLVAAAESVDRAAVFVEAAYPVREAAVDQIFHVEHCAFRAGKYDGVKARKLRRRRQLDYLDVRLEAEGFDVGVVRDAREFYDADAQLFGAVSAAAVPVKAQDVFAFDDYVGEPRHHADDLDAGVLFRPLDRVLEERYVAAEFVEDYAFDAFSVLAEKFKRADDGGERAAAVDVGD